MSHFTLLTALPPEVLADTTCYCSIMDIGRLYFTGDCKLWSKLCAGGVTVLEVFQDEQWAFSQHFQRLHSLSLEDEEVLFPDDIPTDLLTTINRGISSLIVRQVFTELPQPEMFPNLRHLEIDSLDPALWDRMEPIKVPLESFKAMSWKEHGIAFLPSTLTSLSFYCEHGPKMSEWLKTPLLRASDGYQRFPELTTLKISGNPPPLSGLPPGLTSLRLSYLGAPGDVDPWGLFPPKLKTLEFFTNTFKAPLKTLLSTLPPGLTDLKLSPGLAFFDAHALRCLPRGITRLVLEGTIGSEAGHVKIESLSVSPATSNTAEGPFSPEGSLNKHRQKEKTDEISIDDFPPGLLHLYCGDMRPVSIPLPASLTFLGLSKLVSQKPFDASQLPKLRKLNKVPLCPYHFHLLPSTLTKAGIIVHPSDDPGNIESTRFTALPYGLLSLTLWVGPVSLTTSWLPSTLTSLRYIVNGNEVPPVDFLNDLPKSLEKLFLVAPDFFTDAHFAGLRHLPQLKNFSHAPSSGEKPRSMVTGGCFKNLPRSLTEISIPCNIARVLVEHYDELPPDLRMLGLSSTPRAEHYTVDLLEHLPPKLYQFRAPVSCANMVNKRGFTQAASQKRLRLIGFW